MSLIIQEINEMWQEMPIWTDSTIKFKWGFGPFPKHLPTAFDAAVNTWLDNWGCYLESEPHFRNMTRFSLGLPYAGLMMKSKGSKGKDLEDTGSSYSGSTGFQGILWANKLDVGTIGHLYDRVAFQVGTNVNNANARYGCYDSSSGLPTNLYSETGTFEPPASSFQWESLPEFDITVTVNWSAFQTDPTLMQVFFDSGVPSGDRQHRVFTFGAFQNPMTGHIAGSNILNSRIGHS